MNLPSRTELKYYRRVFGIRGVLSAVQSVWLNHPKLHQMKTKDMKFPFCLRFPTSDLQTYEQVFTLKHYAFKVSNQPQTIIDAGANIGLASIYFANRFPEATIIAIEPEIGNFKLLERNISQYPSIIPVQAALWNKNESIELIDPGFGNWGFMVRGRKSPGDNGKASQHSVRGVTVDQIMKEYGIGRINILKVDIEGSEREVFAEPSLWIHNVESLIVELHEDMRAGSEQSFNAATEGFTEKWFSGENHFRIRQNGCIVRPK